MQNPRSLFLLGRRQPARGSGKIFTAGGCLYPRKWPFPCFHSRPHCGFVAPLQPLSMLCALSRHRHEPIVVGVAPAALPRPPWVSGACPFLTRGHRWWRLPGRAPGAPPQSRLPPPGVVECRTTEPPPSTPCLPWPTNSMPRRTTPGSSTRQGVGAAREKKVR